MVMKVCLSLLSVFAVSVAFGLLAVSFGKDMNWDLLNYHYYNAYALLTWRYDLDIAPAQIQSYFNPLLDVPWYLMMQHLPPRAVGFVTGAIQGLNFCVVFWIAWRIVRRAPWTARALVALASATLGCMGAIFLRQLGGTHHDTTLSVLVLAAVALLLETVRGSQRYLVPALAGVLMGVAVALKLTNAVWALGSALALLFVLDAKRAGARVLLVYGLSGFCVVLLGHGPWMWFLWERFDSPVLPFFNNIFQSPWASFSLHLDTRFFPDAFWEYPIWPLIFVADPLRVSEVPFEDYRFALLWLAGISYLVVAACRRFRSRSPVDASDDQLADRAAENFLLAFTLIGFCLWLSAFSIYRYLAPLELLAPLVFGLVLARMSFSPEALTGLLAVLGVFSMLTIDMFGVFSTSTSRFAWDDKYVWVNTGKLEKPAETIVLMTGLAPISYVIPEFPPQVRFLRQGWWSRKSGWKHIREILEAHTGPILLLFSSFEEKVALAEARERFGLTVSPDACRFLETSARSEFLLCPAVKVGGPDG